MTGKRHTATPDRQHRKRHKHEQPKKESYVKVRKPPTGVEQVKPGHWQNPTPEPAISAKDKWIRGLHRAKYYYKHEEIQEDQVRLLFIHPSQNPEANIEVELKTVEFSELRIRYEYEALSYHWGDGDPDWDVYVRDAVARGSITNLGDAVFQTMKRIPVKPNLYKALKSLRGTDDPTALWVDAICINQDNNEEKQSQVARMAQIFNNASNVCIWLGYGDSGAWAAMKFIDDIVKTMGREAELVTQEHKSQWKNLMSLMRSSWFSRRWVIQELAFAREATVHCAAEVVNWEDFRVAISLFHMKYDIVQKLFTHDEKLEDLEAFGAKILIEVTSNIFRKDIGGGVFDRTTNLEELVCRLAPFESSDPRDTVYALLNMARDIDARNLSSNTPATDKFSPPVPDYKRKNLLHVYMDFVRWVIHSTKSLDVICRPWALPERESTVFNYPKRVRLPSWVKDVTNGPYGRKEEALRGRKNGDPFVGHPNQKTYNACYNRHAEAWFAEDELACVEPIAPPVGNTGRPPGIEDNGRQASGATTPLAKSPRAGIPEPSHTKIVEPSFLEPAQRPPNQRRKSDQLSTINLSKLPPRVQQVVANEIDGTSTSATSDSLGNLPSLILEQMSPDEADAPIIRDPSLWVKGFILETITWIFAPTAEGVIFRECLEKGGWHGSQESRVTKVPDKIWRTLVADRGTDGSTTPPWYHLAAIHCLVNCTVNGHLDTRRLLGDREQSEAVKMYLKRVLAVTWNRTFFEAKNPDKRNAEGHFGIGPPRTELGDIIVILFGCSVPCILRRRTLGSGNAEAYEFIGECYVYGKMDGEAVISLTDDELEARTTAFRLL